MLIVTFHLPWLRGSFHWVDTQPSYTVCLMICQTWYHQSVKTAFYESLINLERKKLTFKKLNPLWESLQLEFYFLFPAPFYAEYWGFLPNTWKTNWEQVTTVKNTTVLATWVYYIVMFVMKISWRVHSKIFYV